MVKTCLFGEENYRDDFAMSMAGYALLMVLLIMIIVALAGFVRTIITLKKSETLWEQLALIILTVAEIVSVISFSLKYPHICSMNFRYCTPLIIGGVVYYSRIGEIKLKGANKDLVTKITKVISVAFFVLAVLFYTILWTYVKGEVVVVDSAW